MESEIDRVTARASKRFSCTIIPCIAGRFLIETLPYVHNLLSWMKYNYKIEFDEIACDFIRSTDDKWYFINLRGILVYYYNRLQDLKLTY